MRRLMPLPILAALLMLPCCSAPPPSAPTPSPPVTAPPQPPPPPSSPLAWQDAPLTPGRWTYLPVRDGTSIATFGKTNDATPLFTIRCDKQLSAIRLTRRQGTAPLQTGTIKLATTFGDVQWAASAPNPITEILVASVAATDPALDKMAYSRGRIVIDVSGTERLILPAWPEIARVIEDCRG